MESIDANRIEYNAGQQIYRFFERTGLIEMPDEEFETAFQSMKFEDFREYTIRLNGLLRKIYPYKNRNIDGKYAYIKGEYGVYYKPPEENAKLDLAEKVFKTLKEIDARYRPALAYYALQMIHPFSDGNGRLGRLLFEILSSSRKELTEEYLEKLLNHETMERSDIGDMGREIISEKIKEAPVSRYYAIRELVKDIVGAEFLLKYSIIRCDRPIVSVSYLNTEVQEKLTEEEVKVFESILYENIGENFPIPIIAFILTVMENGLKITDFFAGEEEVKRSEAFLETDLERKVCILRKSMIIEFLTVGNVRKFMKHVKETRENWVLYLMDIYINPDKHKQLPDEGDMNIRDVLNNTST